MKRFFALAAIFLAAFSAFASPALDFFGAILNNDVKTVQNLIKSNVSPNIKLTAAEYLSFSRDFDHKTGFFRNLPKDERESSYSKWEARPLHIAVQLKLWKMTKELVNSGADINVLDGLGNSPLSISYAQEDEKIFDFLLKQGASAEIGAINGKPLAACVIEADDVKTLKKFKKRGNLNFEKTDSDGSSLILLAAKADSLNATKWLYGIYDFGFIEKPNRAGETAITVADNKSSRYIKSSRRTRNVIVGLIVFVISAGAICAVSFFLWQKNENDKKKRQREEYNRRIFEQKEEYNRRIFEDDTNYEETKVEITELIKKQQDRLQEVEGEIEDYKFEIRQCENHIRDLGDEINRKILPFGKDAMREDISAEYDKISRYNDAISKLEELKRKLEDFLSKLTSSLQRKQQYYDKEQIKKQAKQDKKMLEAMNKTQAEGEVREILGKISKNIALALDKAKKGEELKAAHIGVFKKSLERISEKGGLASESQKEQLLSLKGKFAELEKTGRLGEDALGTVSKCEKLIDKLVSEFSS